jgi:hypothetical protein
MHRTLLVVCLTLCLLAGCRSQQTPDTDSGYSAWMGHLTLQYSDADGEHEYGRIRLGFINAKALVPAAV